MIKLYFAGAGTPTPTASRFGTSYILQIEEQYLMFDCGPGTTHKMAKLGLWPTQIDHLFFTHHHFDHNVDYACFMLCHWDQSIGQERNLQVWGPKPMLDFHEKLLGENGAFSYDWKARIGHLGSQAVFKKRGGKLPRPAPKYDVREIAAGQVFKSDTWMVTAATARHIEPFMPTLSYRIDTAQGSLVFSSDTGPCKNFLELAAGADAAVIHCWDHQEEMAADLSDMITGTMGAAELTASAGIKTLILSHQGRSLDLPGSREKAIIDISRKFNGCIIFAEELMVLELFT